MDFEKTLIHLQNIASYFAPDVRVEWGDEMGEIAGRCNWGKKVITLNKDYYKDKKLENIISVLFHEIHHLLYYPEYAQIIKEWDKSLKTLFRITDKIGGLPRKLRDDAEKNADKWTEKLVKFFNEHDKENLLSNMKSVPRDYYIPPKDRKESWKWYAKQMELLQKLGASEKISDKINK